MPFAPMNVVLAQPLISKGSISLPYPEGRNEGHFFGGMNHTLAIDGVFFRSPRDFALIPQHDRITFIWNGTVVLPAGALLNLQAEIPGGDYYFDQKTGVTVLNMVHSPLFMVNLASPAPANANYWIESMDVTDTRPLKLAHGQIATPRNVVIHSEGDNSQAIFTIEGEDMYRRSMVEHIIAAQGKNEGKKAFAKISRISSSHACQGGISVGSGDRLGLPVFLPSPGYLLREIINGEAVAGGKVIAGETALPSATTGDRRGTYTVPASVILDGKISIHLLLSLLAPGNIGILDFAG